MVTATYQLTGGDVVKRLMTLYPDSGRLISVASGQVTTDRDSLRSQIQTFWTYVASNMRQPRWEWTAMHFDILAPNAAVLTATYRIPHLNPRSEPHVIAGAWTAAFEKRNGKWLVVQEHLSDVPQVADTAHRH